MLVGRPRSACSAARARAEQAVDVRQRLGVDLVAAREAQAAAVEGEAAQLARPAQLPVVDRVELLHQRRFAQQRAELAGGALPLDAPHARRPARARRRSAAARASASSGSCRCRAALRRRRRSRYTPGASGTSSIARALEVRRQRRLARDLARGDRQHLRRRAPRRRCAGTATPRRRRRGAVARVALEAVARDQAVEVVAACAGIEPARQAHRAQRLRLELEAGALELAAQEAVVEARVVRDEHAARRAARAARRRCRAKRGARVDHLLRDAGERLDRRRGWRRPGLTSVDHCAAQREAARSPAPRSR